MRQLFRAQRKQPTPTPSSLLEGRALFHEMGEAAGTPAGHDVQTDGAGGASVEWLRPDGADPGKVLLYLHGGAYAMGSAMVSRTMLAILLRPLGIIGCSVDYRLAPEDPYPAALDDAVAAYAWLLQRHPPGSIVVAGDSAGGGLAVAMLVAARDRGLPMPAAAALTSPWADLTLTAESIGDRKDRDPALRPELLRIAADAYVGAQADAADPLVSPVFADLSGLPPLLVLVGSEEILHDDATTLVRHALRDGVNAELIIGEGMPHCWTGYAGKLKAATGHVNELAAFLGRHLDTSDTPSTQAAP